MLQKHIVSISRAKDNKGRTEVRQLSIGAFKGQGVVFGVSPRCSFTFGVLVVLLIVAVAAEVLVWLLLFLGV